MNSNRANNHTPRNNPTLVVDTFHDIDLTGPELIEIPAGKFMMGSPLHEAGRYETEGPRHQVTISKRFLLGKTVITVAQFRDFIDATGYITLVEKFGTHIRDAQSGEWKNVTGINWRHDHSGKPSNDNNPVVHVSWIDAKAYVKWLSKITGKNYRLPTEAELEYSIRAGTTSTYWWGDTTPTEKVANIKGEHDIPANDPTWYPTPNERQYAYIHGYTPLYFENYGDGYWGIAPVATYQPNPFGLYDTTGNTWEWTEDCYHTTYHGAPTDGSAWIDSGDCTTRVVRGGSYYCFPRHVRSANRWHYGAQTGAMYIGFRVARDLDY